MDVEAEVGKQTSQHLVEMAAPHSESEPHLHPTRFQHSEGKGFKRQPRAAQHSWSPYTPPANSPALQKDREGLHGGFLPGLWPWTHAQAWQGLCFLPPPSAIGSHVGWGGGSQYPSLAGQAR